MGCCSSKHKMLKLHESPIEYKAMDFGVPSSWFSNRKWTTKVFTYIFRKENKRYLGIEVKTNWDVKFEFLYQFHFIPNAHGHKSTIIRGIGEYKGQTGNYCFLKFDTLSTKSCDLLKHYPNIRMNFQAVIYVLITERNRRFNFGDENVYGKSRKVLIKGDYLHVPIEITESRAPLLYKDLKKDKFKINSREELRRFLQILYGARITLRKRETSRFLRLAMRYDVLTVKKYCEQQMIWKDKLGLSEEKKFKLACRYNLNILMNQLLRNVETVEELANLSSIAVREETAKSNIFKLLIAKMYKDF